MKNFLRALKYALRYRNRLIISIVCALIAAALWGTNFTVVYPVLQLMEKKQNLQAWVAGRLQDVNADIDQREKELDKLPEEKRAVDAQPPSEERNDNSRKLTDQIDTKES